MPGEIDAGKDLDNLRLLSIFHYILAGISAAFACCPFIHVTIGIMMAFFPEELTSHGEPPPPFIGWFFIVIGSLFIVAGWTIAVCLLIAGRFLAKKMRYTYCLVMACIECVFVPFGVILGVFTIIILMRPSVKALFMPAAA
jgi:hypothetical protein